MLRHKQTISHTTQENHCGGKKMYRPNQPPRPLSNEKFKRRTESGGNPKIYAI